MGAADDDAKGATRVEVPERVSKPRLEGAPDFGPRYRVLDVIGKGGMGEVFRAFDTELRTEVAVKIVRDESGSASYQRFLREIALSRKVTNANVLRVYDLVEHDGLRFLTMELVDGEDLAATRGSRCSAVVRSRSRMMTGPPPARFRR